MPRTEAAPRSGPTTPSPVEQTFPAQLGAAARLALEAGGLGVRGVGGLGGWVLARADNLDQALYGRRAATLGVLAALAFFASIYDELSRPDAPLFMAGTTAVFATLAVLLLLARALSLREEDGSWSVGLVVERVGAAISGALEAMSGSSRGERLRTLGASGILLALFVLASRNIATLTRITAEDLFDVRLPSVQALDAPLLWGGGAALALFAALWFRGWQTLREAGRRLQLLPQSRERGELSATVQRLPVLIDCRDKAAIGAAQRCGHPLLERLFEALETWNRPRHAILERHYQDSLMRHLRRRMPEAEPRQEQPIAGTRARADLVVGGAVLIEMKRDLTSSGAQRGIGQMEQYAEIWGDGPLLLVLCGAGRVDAEQLIARRMQALRSTSPVIVVLAARGGRGGA